MCAAHTVDGGRNFGGTGGQLKGASIFFEKMDEAGSAQGNFFGRLIADPGAEDQRGLPVVELEMPLHLHAFADCLSGFDARTELICERAGFDWGGIEARNLSVPLQSKPGAAYGDVIVCEPGGVPHSIGRANAKENEFVQQDEVLAFAQGDALWTRA